MPWNGQPFFSLLQTEPTSSRLSSPKPQPLSTTSGSLLLSLFDGLPRRRRARPPSSQYERAASGITPLPQLQKFPGTEFGDSEKQRQQPRPPRSTRTATHHPFSWLRAPGEDTDIDGWRRSENRAASTSTSPG